MKSDKKNQMTLTPKEIEYILGRDRRIFVSDKRKFVLRIDDKTFEERNRIINEGLFGMSKKYKVNRLGWTILRMKESNKKDGLPQRDEVIE